MSVRRRRRRKWFTPSSAMMPTRRGESSSRDNKTLIVFSAHYHTSRWSIAPDCGLEFRWSATTAHYDNQDSGNSRTDSILSITSRLCHRIPTMVDSLSAYNGIGEWSADEHQRFVEAYKLFPRDWDRITSYVRNEVRRLQSRLKREPSNRFKVTRRSI